MIASDAFEEGEEALPVFAGCSGPRPRRTRGGEVQREGPRAAPALDHGMRQKRGAGERTLARSLPKPRSLRTVIRRRLKP